MTDILLPINLTRKTNDQLSTLIEEYESLGDLGTLEDLYRERLRRMKKAKESRKFRNWVLG